MASKQRLDEVKRYNHLIEKQIGHAVRPYRADGYINLLNKYGTSRDTTENYQYQPENFVSDDELTQYYEGNGLFARIIDAPAEEALKKGFKLKNIDDIVLEEFYNETLEELGWDDIATTAIKWTRLYGGALAVMLIDDGRGLEEPLDWKHIKSIDDIRVFDRSLIQPDYQSMYSYQADDPFYTRGSRLAMPEYYNIYSRHGNFRVHDSRCLLFQNGVLPENCSNTNYQMWGMPEYVRLNRAIRDTEVAHGSAVKLLDRSIQAVYKMRGLASELATEEGEDRVLRRLQSIDMARGLLNSITIDSEGEDYDFRTFSFSGVSDVIETTCNYLSGLTNIPQTILFGKSPSGMNSTGESDLENWYSFVGRIQNRMIKKNLRYLLSIIFKAGIYTKEIKEMPPIKIEFNPMWEESESEKVATEAQRAGIAQTRAGTAQIYVDMGVISPEEVRRKLGNSDEFDIETMLDDYTEKELMENMPKQQEEGAGEQAEPVEETASEPPIEETNNKPIEESSTEVTEEQEPTVTEENVIKEDEEEVELESGYKKDTNCGVGVLVINNGRILAAKRHNDSGYGLLCGPGGHISEGESPIIAACRETEEEFGITPIELIEIGNLEIEPGEDKPTTQFICTKYKGMPQCLDLEMAEPKFYMLDDLLKQPEQLYYPFKKSIDLLIDKFGGYAIEKFPIWLENFYKKINQEVYYMQKTVESEINCGIINIDSDNGWITTDTGRHLQYNKNGVIIAGNRYAMIDAVKKGAKISDEAIKNAGISSQGPNFPCKKFRTMDMLEDHFQRHVVEEKGFNFKTKWEYLDSAREFLTQPCGGSIVGYKTESGEICRYDTKTKAYAKGYPNGNIKTYFVPKMENGKVNAKKADAYYKAWKEKEGILNDE